jgi:hypothetical protein
MKKTLKKLALNRETLQNLETTGLRQAAGEAPIAATGVSNCLECSQYWTQCYCW